MESCENKNKLTHMTNLFAAESAECFDGGSKLPLWLLRSHRPTIAVRDQLALAL
jgi:hypothetical protein